MIALVKPTETSYAPFDGDGRQKAAPIWAAVQAGTRPLAVRLSTARLLVRHLLATGSSAHSGLGSTLWVLRAYCLQNNRPHRVDAFRIGTETIGYTLTLE